DSQPPPPSGVEKEWNGILGDRALEKETPRSGLIVVREEFARLWKAWRKDEPLPVVDFSTRFVAVVTSEEGEIHVAACVYELEGEGKAKLIVTQSGKLRKGFSYAIAVIRRAGIKTLGGKELPVK